MAGSPYNPSGQGSPPIYGDNGNNVLFQETLGDFDQSSLMFGYGGDDTFVENSRTNVFVNNIHDAYYGGEGSDTISYSELNDRGAFVDLAQDLGYRLGVVPFKFLDRLYDIENATGSDYADILKGDGGANVLKGHDGDDTLEGRAGRDTLLGGDGADTIDGGGGNDIIDGGDDDDIIDGGSGQDAIDGGYGDDTIEGGLSADTIDGGYGDDTIDGGNGNDTIEGGFGHDELAGSGGNDTMHGGANNDELDGGAGDDILNGDGNNDRLEGGIGNDDLDGGSGIDTVVFDTGDDVTVDLLNGIANAGELGSDSLIRIENVQTGSGDDVVFGNYGNNVVATGAGDDTVYTVGGTNSVYGFDGEDVLVGYGGVDKLFGGNHDDNLFGSQGNDQLYGGDGDDVLRGGSGADLVIGGAGADDFVFKSGDHNGIDQLTDFEIGVDEIVFGDGFLEQDVAPGGSYAGLVAVVADVSTPQSHDSILMANTAASGWSAIARFDDHGVAEIAAAIQNGELFTGEVSLNPELGPIVNEPEFVFS